MTYGFFGMKCVLVALVLAFLGNDIWEVATSTVDVSKHLPFLMPAFFGIFLGMVLYVERYEKKKHRLVLVAENTKR